MSLSESIIFLVRQTSRSVKISKNMCLCLKIIDFIYFESLNFEVRDSSGFHLQGKIGNLICYWSDWD